MNRRKAKRRYYNAMVMQIMGRWAGSFVITATGEEWYVSKAWSHTEWGVIK
jgi:hypothetical protein